MATITEWTFTADVASQINEILRLASALTADENMQDRVVKEFWKRIKR